MVLSEVVNNLARIPTIAVSRLHSWPATGRQDGNHTSIGAWEHHVVLFWLRHSTCLLVAKGSVGAGIGFRQRSDHASTSLRTLNLSQVIQHDIVVIILESCFVHFCHLGKSCSL